MRHLPPFFALRALEAAVRHNSYSRAADELAVTHGAVSQQIRRLESDLGARLFQRRGNAMIPTAEARRFVDEVRRGLDILQNAVGGFGAAADRDPLIVSLHPGFASRWLPTRLPRLLADPAGANIEMRVEDRLADFGADDVDIAVRYGHGRWEGLEARRLLDEILFPVCSPALAAAFPMRRPQDLFNAPLLHHRTRNWEPWFDACGLSPTSLQSLMFDDSLMLLEAAALGLGVALGRSSLVEADLEAGRLVRPFAGHIDSDRSFYVVWRPGSRKGARIRALCDWLVAEGYRAASATAANDSDSSRKLNYSPALMTQFAHHHGHHHHPTLGGPAGDLVA